MGLLSRVKRNAVARLIHSRRHMIDAIRFESGCVQSRLLPEQVEHLGDVCFRAYSQFGEDGVLQFLTRRLKGIPKTFVEIGVEDYRECNTRFLAEKDCWRGLAVDPNPDLASFLAGSGLQIMRSVDPLQEKATLQNVRKLVSAYGSEPGILSIDIDGIDYWLLQEALQPADGGVRPWVIVVEYRWIFGAELALSVPKEEAITKRFHSSELYYGASLAAWDHLLSAHGYTLVGCSDGPNAFFVRTDRMVEGLPQPSVEQAWRPVWVREGKHPGGSYALTHSAADMLAMIHGLPLIDVRDGTQRSVSEWFP